MMLTSLIYLFHRNVKTGDWKTYEDLLKNSFLKLKNDPTIDQLGDDYFNGISFLILRYHCLFNLNYFITTFDHLFDC